MSVRLWHRPSACSDGGGHRGGGQTAACGRRRRARARRLTAVVVDQVLQAAELRARGDVEAAAVQLPDLVVLHVQPFGVVVVQHGQTVGTCGPAPAHEGWWEQPPPLEGSTSPAESQSPAWAPRAASPPPLA